MIIKKHKIKRGRFTLQVDGIELTKKGIYLLQGDNGTGKTSLLESVLKSNNLEDISQQEKQGLISYFSQQLYPYPSSGYKYLRGCNKELAEEYCKVFDFESLERDITYLSGGEFVILSLIRCLSRDTPIIILDEPTNNLDDEMAAKVQNLLKQLSKEKTILISTHDERINMEYDGMIQVSEGRASFIPGPGTAKDALTLIPARLPKQKLFSRILLSEFNQMMFLIAVFTGLFTSVIGAFYLLSELPDSEKMPDDNVINLMYMAENQNFYIEAIMPPEEVEKRYGDKTDTLTTEELIELSQKEYIEDIYVVDTGYLDGLDYYEEPGLRVFTIPNLVTDIPIYISAFPGTKDFLLSGRLPLDGKKEAMISYEQMQTFFDYEGDVNEMIGEKITIDGEEYTVVGLTSLPHVSISYDEKTGSKYGTIRVSENSGGELNHILAQMKAMNYGDLVYEHVFIRFDKAHEDELMDYLVNKGPSYQYCSNHVLAVDEKAKLWEALPKLILLALGLSLLLSILLILAAGKMFIIVGNRIEDLNNINFLPARNMMALIGAFAVDFLVMTVGSFSLVSFFFQSLGRFNQMLPFFLTQLIVFGLALLIVWKRYKNHA